MCLWVGQKRRRRTKRVDPRYDQQHFDVSFVDIKEIIFESE